jgi:hypothetical protein
MSFPGSFSKPPETFQRLMLHNGSRARWPRSWYGGMRLPRAAGAVVDARDILSARHSASGGGRR